MSRGENRVDGSVVLMNEYVGRSDRDRAAYEFADAGDYTLGQDSRAQSGVPRGRVTAHRLDDSRTYPGTAHEYWLYSPPHYIAGRAVPLMVFLDGARFLDQRINVPVVLDNLIHKREIPVMAGLFINPGDKGPGLPLWGGTDNRSVEYDSTDAAFATFLVEELLPGVRERVTISADANDRGIAGLSSGGAGAFTAAWHRPDEFRKVVSLVGSFTAIRGGHLYPSLVRRTERKPIRAFLQSGAKDLDVVFGNWAIANQDMAAALAYRDYDYQFAFGAGGHSEKHGAALFPEILRWLWR